MHRISDLRQPKRRAMRYWLQSTSLGRILKHPLIHSDCCRSEAPPSEQELFPSLMEVIALEVTDSGPGKPPKSKYRCHSCCELPEAVAQMRLRLGRLQWTNDEEPEPGVCHCCSQDSPAVFCCYTEGAGRLALCGACKNAIPSASRIRQNRGGKPNPQAGRYGSQRRK